MTDIHEKAARGYATAVGAYERGRPDYPAEAVEWLRAELGLRPGVTAVELGAGTGKFTRLLAASGARVVAVEPVEGMRRAFAAGLPEVELVAGTAEATPLATGTADAVVAAQAFHWFDGEAALREIHRVLRPGGRLGLVWNARDESVAWVARLTGLIDPHEGGAPRYRTGAWKAAFERTTRFAPQGARVFRHVQTGPPAMVEDRVASISFIAALPEADRERVLRDVRDLVREIPGVPAGEPVRLPYRTDVFVYERRPA